MSSLIKIVDEGPHKYIVEIRYIIDTSPIFFHTIQPEYNHKSIKEKEGIFDLYFFHKDFRCSYFFTLRNRQDMA